MDKKIILAFWIVVNIFLLGIAYQAVGSYWNLAGTLKSPCGVCEKENPGFESCLYEWATPKVEARPAVEYPQINLTQFKKLKKEN